MKAPLSQHFKLQSQTNYKRAHFDDSNPSSGRAVPTGTSHDAYQRTSHVLQNMKMDNDYYHRRSSPTGTQPEQSRPHSNPLGGDIQSRSFQPQPETSTTGTHYRSIQQPSISYSNNQFRSPAAQNFTAGVPTGTSHRNDSLNYMNSHSSREDENPLSYQGTAERLQRAREENQQQLIQPQRISLSGRNTGSNLMKNNYVLSTSVEQTATKYQPFKADYSPQMILSNQRLYQNNTLDILDSASHSTPFHQDNIITRFNPTTTVSADRHNEESPNRGEESRTLNHDMEQIIVSLHSKMKNLESKYIDLANFYKKELVTQKQSSQDHSPYHNLRDNLNRSKSPNHRFSTLNSQQEPMDQSLEKAIISDLLQEKQDLEKELQAMIQIQSRLMEEESRLNKKLEIVERENQNYRSRSAPNQRGLDFQKETVNELKGQVQQILDKFEEEFLEYINQNYQNFTENDVLGMFGALKAQIGEAIDSIIKMESARKPFTQLSASNSQNIQINDSKRKRILDNYKKDIGEYEINNEYTVQSIKKAAFELKNKHDTTKLDLKKVNLTLQTLSSAASELQSLQNSSLSQSFDRPNSSSLGQKSSNILDFRVATQSQQILGSPNAAQQKRLVQEISTQVQTLQSVFSGINRKLSSCDVDLKVLQDVEEECQNNIEFLKQGYERMIKEFDRQTLSSNRNNASSLNSENDDAYSSQKHLLELKVINDKLQRELQMSTEKFTSLKLENQSLYAQLENNRSNNNRSPYSRNVGQSASSQSSIQEEHNFSHKLQILETENQSLTRKIRTLTRTVDEKQQQIEIMGKNLTQFSKQNSVNSGAQVSLDQVQFYQRLYEQGQDKTKLLLKLTQRFLYAMKKLQKAVHRKEQNVQKEKNDFELSRKELELLLKQMKKELGDDTGDQRQPRITIEVQARGNSGVRASSLGERISNDDQPNVKAQIHKYQNKIPNTLSARNHEKPISMKIQSASNKQSHLQTSINKSQINQYSVNQSLGTSSVLYDNYKTLTAEKSPVPLRTKAHHSGNSTRNSQQQQEMFHSIEAVNRRHNTLLGSVERPTQNRSPSHDPFGQNYQRLTIENQQNSLNQTLQVSNMKNEITLLRQEIQDLMRERETLNSRVIKVERDKDGLQMERQQLEKQLDRERKMHEAARREMNDLELEKESLIQEMRNINFKAGPQMFHSESRDMMSKELYDAQDHSEKMFEQLQIVERINQEYQRTIGFLEESAEVAKQTIIDLKENLSLKDLEIEELMSNKLHHQQKSATKTPISSHQQQPFLDLDQVKSELKSHITTIEEDLDSRYLELDTKLQSKELELNKLKRMLDRKLKEKEMMGAAMHGEGPPSRNKELENRVQDLEKQLQEAKLEIECQKLNANQENQGSHPYDLQVTINELNDQLSQHKLQYDQALLKLQADHAQELAQLKSENERQLQLIQQNEQENLELILQQKDLETQEQIFKANEENIDALKKAQEREVKVRGEYEERVRQVQEELEKVRVEGEARVLEERRLASTMQTKDSKDQFKKLEDSLKKRWELEAQTLQSKFKQEQLQLQSDYDSEIHELKQQIDTLQAQNDHLRKDQLAKDKTIGNQKSLIGQLESQIKEQDVEHRGEIQSKEQEMGQMLKEVEERFSKEKEREVNSIKQGHQKAQEQLQKQLRDQVSRITELEQTIQEQDDQLRRAQDDGTSQTKTLRSQLDQIKVQLKAKEQDLALSVKNREDLILKSEDLQSRVDEIENELQSKEQSLKQIQSELQSEKVKANKSLAELQGKMDKIMKEKEDLKQIVEQMELHEHSFTQQIKNEQQSKDELKQKLSEAQKANNLKLKEVQDKLIDLQGKYDQLMLSQTDQVKELNHKEQELKRQAQEEASKVNDLQNKLSHAQSQFTQAQIALEASEKQIVALQNELEQTKNNNETLIKSLEKQNEELQNHNAELEGQISIQKATYEGLNSQLSTASQQLLAIKKESQEKDQEVADLKQQLSDSQNESAYVKSMRQSLQTQLDKMQKEFLDKDAGANQMTKNLQTQLDQFRQENQVLRDTNNDLQNNLNQAKLETESQTSKIESLLAEKQKLQKLHDHELQSLKTEMDYQLQERDQLKVQLEQQIEKQELQIRDLQNERVTLQDQMMQMINHSTSEKQTVEAQLQAQLSEALLKIQQKEQLLSQKENETYSLAEDLRQARADHTDFSRKIKSLEDELEQLAEENQAMEEQKSKHQQTLESNRNLIQMLKTELEKSIEKNKVLEAVTQVKDIPPVTNTNENELNSQIEKLKEALNQAKVDEEDKLMDLRMQIDSLEQELKAKSELIEEANKYIEEFYDEKNELKAKFKHLQQVLDDVEEESSYKGDEEEIDLEKLFERFEGEFLRHKQNIESKIELIEKDNSQLKEQVKLHKDELALIEANMAETKRELSKAHEKLTINTEEMKKQMEIAQRKIQNYKDKLIEKQKYLNQIENEKKQQHDSAANASREPSLMKENLELLQKLQKAENELQTFRLSNNRGVAHQRRATEDSAALEDSLKVDAQRIQQIEDQLINLRKQLFQAKDQVLDQLSEQFARKLRELTKTYQNEQVLRGKLSEIKNESQIQQVLNNNIKMIKAVEFTNKRFLIVQVLSNNECYVIDDSKLTEGAQQYLKSYLPQAEDLNTSKLEIDEKAQIQLDKLAKQVSEIKEERQELWQEIAIYKAKMGNGEAFEEMRGLKMVELEDDVGHLTAENLEFQEKLKQLSEKNVLLQRRVIELNELIRDLTSKNDGGESANRKLVKLKEENESLRQQLVRKSFNRPQVLPKGTAQVLDEEEVEDGSFLQGIQVADNMNNSQQDNNLFDQSSLYGVIEGLEEGQKNFAASQQYQHQEQTISNLQKQLEEANKTNRVLQQEVQKSQQQTLNPNEQSVIHHIKGTLIQFLKNTPLTDKNNEELLAIIFSMMEFSKEEISEVQDYRRGRQQSAARGSSQSSHGNNPSEPDEEAKSKTRKGIFGMFKKKGDKEGSVSRKQESGNKFDEQIISPARPLKRN